MVRCALVIEGAVDRIEKSSRLGNFRKIRIDFERTPERRLCLGDLSPLVPIRAHVVQQRRVVRDELERFFQMASRRIVLPVQMMGPAKRVKDSRVLRILQGGQLGQDQCFLGAADSTRVSDASSTNGGRARTGPSRWTTPGMRKATSPVPRASICGSAGSLSSSSRSFSEQLSHWQRCRPMVSSAAT